MPTFGRIRKSTGVVVAILPACWPRTTTFCPTPKRVRWRRDSHRYSLSAGVPINFSGTLAIVMPGGWDNVGRFISGGVLADRW